MRSDATGHALAEQHRAVIGVQRGWRDLDGWYRAEVERLATSQGWSLGGQVLLRTWLERLPGSQDVSADALARYHQIGGE